MSLGWYSYNPEYTVRVYEDEFVTVDYNKIGKMYRVTIFEDGHFSDEFWFNEYKEKEVELNSNCNDTNRCDNCKHSYEDETIDGFWQLYCMKKTDETDGSAVEDFDCCDKFESK